MRIYIPTIGRTVSQLTYHLIPKKYRDTTVLVVSREEARSLHQYPYVVCPVQGTGMGRVRQWIVDHHQTAVHGRKLVMVDDDLHTFSVRREDNPNLFTPSEESDRLEMWRAIENKLNRYAHVGLLGREGGNRVHEDLECSRMMRVLAYDINGLRKHDIRFDVMEFQEDFYVTLKLLTLGYKNRVLSKWVQDQKGSNSSGGCSDYRTLEKHGDSVKKLASLFPEFVKVVEKTTKTAWNGQKRLDVIIQWKKAYESSHPVLR